MDKNTLPKSLLFPQMSKDSSDPEHGESAEEMPKKWWCHIESDNLDIFCASLSSVVAEEYVDKILNWLIEQAMKPLEDIYPDAELVIEKISKTEEPGTGYKVILLIVPEPPRYWDVLVVENGIERGGTQSNHWQMAEAVGAMFDAMLSKISLRDFVEFINEAVYGDIL